MKRVRGFTLIELMIVVLVVAVLAGIALSGYQKQIRKSRRAEARQVLGDYSLRQERYRSNHTTYATDLQTLLNVATAPTSWGSGYYTVALSTPSGSTCQDGTTAYANTNSFTITATPTSTTGQNKDTACPTIVLSNLCGSITKSPAECW